MCLTLHQSHWMVMNFAKCFCQSTVHMHYSGPSNTLTLCSTERIIFLSIFLFSLLFFLSLLFFIISSLYIYFSLFVWKENWSVALYARTFLVLTVNHPPNRKVFETKYCPNFISFWHMPDLCTTCEMLPFWTNQ